MHYSLRAPAFAVILLALASHSLHAQGSSRAFNEKAPTVPLSDVIAATESALDDYQTYAKSPASIKDGLPPLATADFASFYCWGSCTSRKAPQYIVS